MSPKDKVINMRVVGKIREAVAREGVRGFARISGLSPSIVTRYMQGKTGEPTTTTLEKLAAYFGVTVGWLREDGITGKHGGLDFNMVDGGGTTAVIGVCDKCGNDVRLVVERNGNDEDYGGYGPIKKIVVSPCENCCKKE